MKTTLRTAVLVGLGVVGGGTTAWAQAPATSPGAAAPSQPATPTAPAPTSPAPASADATPAAAATGTPAASATTAAPCPPDQVCAAAPGGAAAPSANEPAPLLPDASASANGSVAGAPSAPSAPSSAPSTPGTTTAQGTPGAPGTPGAAQGAVTASGGAGAASLGAATNPFRNSWFTINANASAKTFGVGRDYIGSEDEVVSTDYAFTPRYSFINTKKDWVWLGLNINWAVEHTNSDSTTYKNQTLFGDLGVQSAYNHTFLRKPTGLFFLGGPRASFTLPTSLASQGQGIYARTNLGLGALGNVPFHEKDWFNGVFLSTGASWQHTFSNSNVPYNEDLLNRPRQGLGYQPVGSQLMDQSHMLSGRFLTHDQLSLNLTSYFTVIDELSLGLSSALQLPSRYTPTSADCLDLLTGCVDVKSGVNNATPQPNIPVTVFDASLNYTAFGVAWVTVGYNNSTRQLGEDGTRENYFYSTSAQFYGSLTLMLDVMYNKYKASQAKQSAMSPVAAALGF